jgi:bacillolysin
MERAGHLQVQREQANPLRPGRTFVRLVQFYQGVPVWGGEVVRETDGMATTSLTAVLYQGIAIDPTPVLSQEDIKDIFQRELVNANRQTLEPELTIFPRADGTFVLTYRVSQFTGNELPVLFINANSGVVEHRYDNLQKQSPVIGQGTGVFGDEKKVSASAQLGGYLAWDRMRLTSMITLDMKGDVWRVLDVQNPGGLPLNTSDVAFDSDNVWTDAAVVDAHTYLGWTYDFYFRRFGWKGLDGGDGRTLYAMVHSVARRDFVLWLYSYWWPLMTDYYVNSSFCPGCGYDGTDLLMFGEGLPSGWYYNGQTVDYSAGSIDTVSHEYSHGVTAYTSNLIYENESGALNESFSDVMADSVEWFYQPAGSGIMKADYLQGEDDHRAGLAGSKAGIRSLADPAAYDCGYQTCPDHYTLRYRGSDDHGGVHVNSSIANHAFYLAIEGGTNRVSKLSVEGVGASNREQIERVFFLAFLSLPSSATFSLARVRTIAVAQDLYGAGSPADRAVTQAWTAVGVF